MLDKADEAESGDTDLGAEDFASWYGTTQPEVLRVLCAVSGDREGASDAVAEAFARALARWKRVRRMHNPSGWVYRVALNQWRRETKRRGVQATFVLPRDNPGLETDYEVWEAVARLPRRQREVLALRHIAQLSVADTARILHVSVSTVTSTLTDARHRLGRALDTDDG